MKWEFFRLGDISVILMGNSPAGTEYNQDGIGLPLITGAGQFGKTTPEPTQFSKSGSRITKKGDIIICIRATIGDLNWADKDYYLGRGVAAIRVGSELDSKYLWYYIATLSNYFDRNATGSTFRQINKETLNEIQIPLPMKNGKPDLLEQQRIAGILDQADSIRRKRQQALQLTDDFLRATFLDLFGDPVTNPKGWETCSLTTYGSFKNGLNFGKGETGATIHCLGVGHFKAFSKIKDVTNLPKITLNTLPSNEYYLEDGDLLFVRSNGNKALVGRCVSVYPGNTPVTFSGFCIRYRINDSQFSPSYLAHLFRVSSFKSSLLQGGQGANIQNINQQTLSALKVPKPPIAMQEHFVSIVDQIETIKGKLLSNNTDDLFASLQQRAFKGEL